MKLPETTTERIERKLDRKLRLIRVARGEEPADVVFKNATYLNVFSNDFCHGDIAVSNGLVAGIGSYRGIEEIDVSGRFVSPGFIDAHIHLESSMVSPAEFARAVVSQRVPPGMTMMYHAQERIMNIPGSEVTGMRGGIHNSVTRVCPKPTHMIGGYAQLAWGFNYYGTVGSNRDEFVVVRKMKNIDWLDGEGNDQVQESVK